MHVEPSTFPAYEFTGYSIDGKPACPFFKELLQRLRPLRDCLCREVPDVGVTEPSFDGGHAVFRCGRVPPGSAQVDCCTWGRKFCRVRNVVLFGWFARHCAPSAVAFLGVLSTESSKFLGVSVRDKEYLYHPKANNKYTILSKSVNISQRTLLFFQINFANILKKN